MADPHLPTQALPPRESEPDATFRRPSKQPAAVAPGANMVTEPPGTPRYEELTLLGEGGMGEVRLCRDTRIGREVARKAMREAANGWTDGLQRFVREARVQGQLEHPVVVPVYELGEEQGKPFFTMKRVHGQTLSEVISALSEGDAETMRQYTRRKLLSAFSQICLAVDFAHSRGVLHRDLKPANVMLGDFGEVHLLDWGLAKIHGVDELPTAARLSPVAGDSGGTMAGEVMGTPGYMAPEQARGELHSLSPRSDVYALGVILFELLTLQLFHKGDTANARISSTVQPHEVHPRERAPSLEIPPELDSLVARACAFDPSSRLPSARALSEAIERFLDGDRDQERRVALAKEHVAAAAAAMKASSRADAMREVTRALALIPDEPEALRILGQLLSEMPDELPPAAAQAMETAQAAARVRVAGVAAARAVTWFAFVPLVAWMGVRDWGLAAFTLTALFLSLLAALVLRRKGNVTNRSSLGLLLLSSVALAGVGFVLSPFVLVPALAATNTLFFATHLSARWRPLAALAGVVAVLAPVALEAVQILFPSYEFKDGMLLLVPRMTWLPPTATMTLLIAGSTALVITPAVLVGRLRDSLEEAEKKLFLHAWHLKALAPAATESAAKH